MTELRKAEPWSLSQLPFMGAFGCLFRREREPGEGLGFDP